MKIEKAYTAKYLAQGLIMNMCLINQVDLLKENIKAT